MSDQKISELTNITGANLADADEFVVVDVSADQTKAVTLGELKEAFDTGSGFVRITGDTMTGNLTVPTADINGGTIDGTVIGGATPAAVTGTAITGTSFASTGNMTFGDNDKAMFGAGNDLQISHDGNNSIIDEVGTGSLFIRGTTVNIQHIDSNPNEQMINAIANGAVTLSYNGSPKIATSASGIDVTGNATFADNGKAIFGAGSDLQIFHNGSNSYVQDNGTGVLIVQGSAGVHIQGRDATDMIRANEGADVALYHNDIQKLATTSTGVDVTGTVAATDLVLDTTNPTITSSDADGFLGITGGTSGALGGNMRLYGPTHASFANDIVFRTTTAVQFRYDDSASTWNFQANDITTTGAVTATSYAGDGSGLTGVLSKGPDIGGSVDLNTYTTDGYYHQNNNANTASGSNYPADLAGMLTVTSDGSMVYQHYQTYNGSGAYQRTKYNVTWHAWDKILDSGNLTTTGTVTATSYTEAVFVITGTTPALDPVNGSIQTWTLTAASTPTNSLSSGESMTLMIEDGTAYSITWPTMTWVNNGGAAPTLATSGKTVVALWKVAGNLYGSFVGNGS